MTFVISPSLWVSLKDSTCRYAAYFLLLARYLLLFVGWSERFLLTQQLSLERQTTVFANKDTI